MFQKNSHRQTLVLILTIASVTCVVASAMLWMLYQNAFNNFGARLQEINNLQATIVNSLSSYNKQTLNNQDALATTIEVLQEANKSFKGVGRTGEFTLAMRQGEEITYFISQRLAGTPGRDLSLFHSNLSQPMQRALSGNEGIMTGQDYRGETVLAAYEYIAGLQLGLVTKVDLAEIRAPFVRAAILSFGSGLLLVAFGTLFYLRFTHRLSEQENILQFRYESLLDTALDGIITINRHGTIQAINSSALKMFGYNKSELVGKNINKVVTSNIHDAHDNYLANVTDSNKRSAVDSIREIEGKKKNGTLFPLDLALSQMKIENETFYTGILRDASERKRIIKAMEEYKEHLEVEVEKRTQDLSAANKKLEKLANLDGLTEIPNRRVFDNVIKRELSRAIRNHSSLSLLLCDVDYFKNYNDTYGHLAGDECLKKIARTIQQLFQRAGDVVARYGGEEFAVILPNVLNPGLQQVTEQIREAIWALNIVHLSPNGTGRVTISVGAVSVTPNKDMSENQIIQYADDALYEAKQKGRNTVHCLNINDTDSKNSI